jgi:hypothetical protein
MSEEVNSEFWWRNMKERFQLEDLDEDGKLISKWI